MACEQSPYFMPDNEPYLGRDALQRLDLTISTPSSRQPVER